MNNQLVNGEDVCRIFKISRGMLAKLKNDGMPYIAIGRCIRYSLPDVQHWIMQQQNKDENDSDELQEEVYNGNTC